MKPITSVDFNGGRIAKGRSDASSQQALTQEHTHCDANVRIQIHA